MTRQARYSAGAATLLIASVTLIALFGGDGEDSACLLVPSNCADIERTAPDPGGSEDPATALPPGKAFGFNESPQIEGVDQGQLEYLATSAGANARRFPLDWRQVEPSRDVWNEGGWAYYSRTYEAILQASMTPVIDFGFAPTWARDTDAARACADFFACRYPPARAMDDEWREFAAEVARRYPEAVLEVWNEPNLAIFWRPAPDPERFAELQASAYDAIKAVRPDAIVLAGGLAVNSETESRVAPAVPPDMPLREFLERAYDARPSIRGKMDALSFHPYPYGPDLGAGSFFAKSFQDVRATMAANGDAGHALWVTETGIATTGAFAVSEAQQEDILKRLVSRIATMSDVGGVLVHRLLPPPTEPADSTEVGYALLRSVQPPFEPKPAYCGLVELGGGSYPGCPSAAR